MPFYKKYNESCFTYHDNNGTFIRGCTLDDEKICDENKNKEFCELCDDSNACNRKKFIKQQCIYCGSSDDYLSCLDVKTSHVSTCSVSYDQRGCYTKRKSKLSKPKINLLKISWFIPNKLTKQFSFSLYR